MCCWAWNNGFFRTWYEQTIITSSFSTISSISTTTGSLFVKKKFLKMEIIFALEIDILINLKMKNIFSKISGLIFTGVITFVPFPLRSTFASSAVKQILQFPCSRLKLKILLRIVGQNSVNIVGSYLLPYLKQMICF